MLRTPRTYKPDANLEGVSPEDIQDRSIEVAHLNTEEIPFVITKTIPASANAQVSIVTAPFKMRILDVIVQCLATNALGTLTINDDEASPTAITNAIACAVNKTVTHAGTIDYAVDTIAAGSKIGVAVGGTDATATTGKITIVAVKVD